MMPTKTAQRQTDPFLHAARKAVRRAGWDPKYDLEILKPKESGEAHSVRYGYRAGKVRLHHAPELIQQTGQAVNAINHSGLRDTAGALEDVVASRVYLQVGAFKVCPFSSYDYAEILDATADGLRSIGAADADVNKFTVPVTSLFIASIVSGVYAVTGPDPATFRRGWALDQIVTSLGAGTDVASYVAVYAAIQLRLWSDDELLAENLRARFPRPSDALEFETDRGVAILLDTFEFVENAEDGLVWRQRQTRELLIDELTYNWRRWPIKAYQIAELIGPYIVGPNTSGSPPAPTQQPAPGERPSQQASRRRAAVRPASALNVQELLRADDVPGCELAGVPADPFADRMRADAWFRQQVLRQAIGQGKNPLNHTLSFEALDVVYRSRATSLEVETEHNRRAGMAFDISHMSREELDGCLPGLNSIDWGATRLNMHGDLVLYRPTMPISDATPATEKLCGFPDLLFVCDSSGSMKWSPKEGIGPYDSLLRAIYSVLAFLEKHKKAQHMKFAAVNFSANTLKTPWCSYSELRDVKKLLFQYQGGGTTLNCGVLESIATTSADKFLCLMVTDGQIANAASVIKSIESMTRRGHGFILIQIGGQQPMMDALRALKLPVFLIQDHRQLAGLCLDFTRRIWAT